MTKGIHKVTPIKRSIPIFIARPTGQIIAKWSFLEYRLSMIIWELIGVDDQIGRMTVANPRGKEKLEVIRTLLHLKGKELKETEYKRLYNGLKELEEKRDMLAHGIWVLDESEWKIIQFSGQLHDQTVPKLSRKRKLRPESLKATSQGFAVILQSLDAAIASIEHLSELVSSLETKL